MSMPDARMRLLVGLNVFVVLFALALVGGATVLVHREPRPWATFPEPIGYVGELDAEAGLVVRQVTDAGVPVVTDATLDAGYVRCGPPDETTVIVWWTWTVRSPDRHTETYSGGPSTFVVPPAGCGAFDASLSIPHAVGELAARYPGSLVRLELLTDNTGPVPSVPTPVRTEWFLLDPTGTVPTTDDVVQLAVPNGWDV